ncbi:MAG: hypothetical protein NVSMB9_20800 [Isosphaeraceae bacterium]
MNSPLTFARIDEPTSFQALAKQLRDWEPRIDLYLPPRDALLYEPDGTLYAVCLAEEMTCTTDRKVVSLLQGDALVLPRGHALDAGPDVDVLALRYDGPPPDHFRERFIQVWGFEHVAVPHTSEHSGTLTQAIPLQDVRHRIPYAVLVLDEGTEPFRVESTEVALFLGLNGSLEVVAESNPKMLRQLLTPRSLVLTCPGVHYRLEGQGRAGILTIFNELAHENRRREACQRSNASASPEYRA